MKVLYVVGACLTKNTSANMSHNAYVQGLLENDCNVDILMAEDSWGEQDAALPRWETAHYFEFRSVSFADRLRKTAKRTEVPAASGEAAPAAEAQKANVKQSLRSLLKSVFYVIFPNDPIYPLEHKWLKEAAKFKNNEPYDLVISNSSPAASHKLVSILKEKNRIQARRWVQERNWK